MLLQAIKFDRNWLEVMLLLYTTVETNVSQGIEYFIFTNVSRKENTQLSSWCKERLTNTTRMFHISSTMDVTQKWPIENGDSKLPIFRSFKKRLHWRFKFTNYAFSLRNAIVYKRKQYWLCLGDICLFLSFIDIKLIEFYK